MNIEIDLTEDNEFQSGINNNINSISGGSTVFPVVGVWGIVQRTHSEDVSIDVLSTAGIEYRRVKVRSLEWAGVNDDTAFGERDLPPIGAKVFVLFPDGMSVVETSFALCSVVDTVYKMQKAKDNLAIDNKDREYKKVNEAGWEITYDKDSGDYLIKSTGSTAIEIHAKKSDGSVSIKSGSSELKIDSNGQIISTAHGATFTLDSNGQIIGTAHGATIKINSSGGIDVTPSAGQSIILNNGTILCNNLPNCIFSGAPHGTNTGVKC